MVVVQSEKMGRPPATTESAGGGRFYLPIGRSVVPPALGRARQATMTTVFESPVNICGR